MLRCSGGESTINVQTWPIGAERNVYDAGLLTDIIYYEEAFRELRHVCVPRAVEWEAQYLFIREIVGEGWAVAESARSAR